MQAVGLRQTQQVVDYGISLKEIAYARAKPIQARHVSASPMLNAAAKVTASKSDLKGGQNAAPANPQEERRRWRCVRSDRAGHEKFQGAACSLMQARRSNTFGKIRFYTTEPRYRVAV
jgi:hypothetical protein